jgi:hypothetical protein
MPDRMPDRMPEDMSDRMPEDLPVRKCINVMVGITRSKVIVFNVFVALVLLAVVLVEHAAVEVRGPESPKGKLLFEKQ